MSWLTPTTTAGSDPVSALDLETDRPGVVSTLVGRGLRGSLYRSSAGDAYYRVMRISDAPVEWRYRIREGPSHGADTGILRPDRDWQAGDTTVWLVVRYPVEPSTRTLAEALADPDPASRLDGMARALVAVRGWWATLSPPLFPLPADIVLDDRGGARLLWMPPGPLPGPSRAFEAPELGLYLAPELIRDRRDIARDDRAALEAIDRYALGVALMSCYSEAPTIRDAGTILRRAACGTLLSDLPTRANLPVWLSDFSVHRHVIAAAHRLVAAHPLARAEVDLANLARLLDDERRRLDPGTAARELRDTGRPHEALTLIEDVLPLRESYDLLILAGGLASSYLDKPLEAIRYFERARGLDPARPQAHEGQFDTIATAPHSFPLSLLVGRDAAAATQLDVLLWRDFKALGPAEQSERERTLAEYLLWRGEFGAAADLLHSCLVVDGEYRWWLLDLNLLYVRAIIGQGRYDDAGRQLDSIKWGLRQVKANQSLEEDRIHDLGEIVAELDHELYEYKVRACGPGPDRVAR